MLASTPVASQARSPISYGEGQNTLTPPPNCMPALNPPEGEYRLRDTIGLGVIPPPPSETHQQTFNVLDPNFELPPHAHPILSVVNVADTPTSVFGNDPFASTEPTPTEESTPKKTGTSNGASRLLASGNLKNYMRGSSSQPLGSPKTVTNRDSKEFVKRKKPKASITKSSSSMIQRVSPHEALSKRLQEHKADGHYAFVNNGRGFLWLDLSSSIKHQQLTKIVFAKAHPICHDVNVHTKSPSHVDVLMGFSTGDILWYEPMSQKYTHFNKNGVIHSQPVTSIRWCPPHENIFVAAHKDGWLVFYDKEKDDAALIEDENAPGDPGDPEPGKRRTKIEIRRLLKSPAPKTNPVAAYRVARNTITDMAFSSSGRFLATTCDDGALRIIDLEREALIDHYTSSFGGMNCVAWSPDDRYLLTGGEDDMVSLWSFEAKCLTARCKGHKSYIQDVAFDPWRWDESNYRFASVGDDRQILLWDFSTGLVQKPRGASVRPSVVSLGRPESGMASRTSLIRSLEATKLTDEDDAEEEEEEIVHPRAGHNDVLVLISVWKQQACEHPLQSVRFTEDAVLVSCQSGHILTYDRPTATIVEGSEGSASAGSGLRDPFR